jgi:hypothetical protein
MKNHNGIARFGLVIAGLLTSAASWSATYPLDLPNTSQTFKITEARLYKPTRADLRQTLFLDMDILPVAGGEEKKWRLRIDTKTGQFTQEHQAHSANQADKEIKAADLIEGGIFQSNEGPSAFLNIKMKLSPKIMEMAGPDGLNVDKIFGDDTSGTAVSIEGDDLILNLAEFR